MRKIRVSVLVIVVGIISFASFYMIKGLNNKCSDTVHIDTINVIYDDNESILPDYYMGMTEEEFTNEMVKGVQGDYTLEQIDSMQRSWATQDSKTIQTPH